MKIEKSSKAVRNRFLKKLNYLWYVIMSFALTIPIIIFSMHLFADLLPSKPESGAFILALGAVSIIFSFPFFSKFKELNIKIQTIAIDSSEQDINLLKSMNEKMIYGYILAEIPSLAGFLHYLFTTEIFASLILCAPSIVYAILFKPANPYISQNTDNSALKN